MMHKAVCSKVVLQSKGRNNFEPTTKRMPFKCKFCSRCFRYLYSLRMHVKDDHPNISIKSKYINPVYVSVIVRNPYYIIQ